MSDQRARGSDRQRRQASACARKDAHATPREVGLARVGANDLSQRISAKRSIAARATGWTTDRRVRQSTAIRRWAPWTRATGPTTAIGKARSASNAFKGSNRQWWRAVDQLFAIYRKRPGAQTINECELVRPLTVRERSAMLTYARLNPLNRPLADRIVVGGRTRE